MNIIEIGYTLLTLAGLALVLFARARPDFIATPRQLLNSALHQPATRIGVIIIWWWLGWHFLAVA